MCTSVSACVVFSLSHLQLALSWQASPLPLSIHNGARREPAVRLPLPPLALPWVCKQISAHVTSRFASQLSSPSALPRFLCPPICRQKEGRMSQTLTNRAPASMLMLMCMCLCMCLCVHTPVRVYARMRQERHLQQSRGRPWPVMCAWLMF